VSPNAAIIQGLIVGILIAVLEAFGWQWEAIGVAGGALALVILVAWIGRAPRRNFEDAPGSGRVKEEGKEAEAVELKKIGLSVGLLVAPGLIVLLFKMLVNDFGDVPHGPSRGTALAMILIAAVAGDLIYMSTLTDWFYVRPYLRGGCGSICATSLEDQWRGVTRIWLLHRALAVLGAIAAVTALTALAANTWIRPIDEVVAGAIGGVAAVIAGYYLTRAASLLAIAINPPVQVGDVIEIAEEFNVYEPDELREYFVVDVALEGVKLLRLGRDHLITRSGPDAKRTHDRTVDVMDISKLLRGRRAVKPCADKCQKLTEHCDCKVAWTLPKRTEASTAAPKPA
jgi:MFS family permease